MTTTVEPVNFYKPIWRAFNQDAKDWVQTVLSDIGIQKPKQRQCDAMASFLYTARWCLLSSRSLACPRVRDYWSKYPLVGAPTILDLTDKMQGKYLHKIDGSGRLVIEEDEQGKKSPVKITTLHEVDSSLLESPYFDTSEFIDVGRPQVLVGKKETEGQKEARKLTNSASPKFGLRAAEREFKKPYHEAKDEVGELNKFYQLHPLRLPANGFTGALCGSVGRIFHHGRLDAGGRFYGGYTGLNGALRLKSTIDGEPIVQIDLNAAQPILFSSLMGYRIKDTGREKGGWEDLYGDMAQELVTGDGDRLDDERSKCKAVGVEVIGYGNPLKKRPSPELKTKHGITTNWEFEIYRDKILEWVPALQHLDREYLNGAGFITFHESQIVLKTIQELHSQGVPAYPMHDCLILREVDQELGLDIFRQVANRYIQDHCKANNRPEVINVMVACSLESDAQGKERVKGYYLD
ncbi:hypothetical protein PXK17_11450 [Phaeobacter gallaeciensis]|uniref:DNA-directed RNA polymerase n=1 Tax=Phaeobacter gallaeciensis TaxID=60890 RepID=A0ABD4X9W9_9RHOB|nr:hypothetical protein [Phaeobacter gallaeciensis]MDE4145241.1 hypothetical protein [Phaeobacter gallaeciensis]MDE4157912.1 hypothetical protein [Phaeobacter gallaeciensis]MDE4162091.1 hypothetical protein [Phaeobacter gallaeciensis]MDE4166316.1 hypothetical protein [Phaeobacter gallaeciensis]MDE4170740.1 hypothetical protein [Phaeobacter gallaeciensis]